MYCILRLIENNFIVVNVKTLFSLIVPVTSGILPKLSPTLFLLSILYLTLTAVLKSLLSLKLEPPSQTFYNSTLYDSGHITTSYPPPTYLYLLLKIHLKIY